VVLEPSYGQLDYYSPILLALAREYRRPIYEHLARWDKSLGSLQRTRYATPHGEELLFELGGYAYLWCDDSVPDQADEKKLSWSFPSVGEAYARVSWNVDDLLVGAHKGNLVIHAGGHAVLIHAGNSQSPTNIVFCGLQDDGRRAVIRYSDGSERFITAELDRPKRRLLVRRNLVDEWQWWCHETPNRKGNVLYWNSGVSLTVKRGSIGAFELAGYTPKVAVGNGLLELADPIGKSYPLVKILAPAKGETIIEVKYKPR